jgi:hypothetical protein
LVGGVDAARERLAGGAPANGPKLKSSNRSMADVASFETRGGPATELGRDSATTIVEHPDDLRRIARVVIAAFEKWEAVQGLGA